MKIFIVFWNLYFAVPEPCPDIGKLNQYGIQIQKPCPVQHIKTVIDARFEMFQSSIAAYQFLYGMPPECRDSKIYELREIKIKKEKKKK